MTKEELIKNQFPNDEFLQSGVSQIVDKCTVDLEKENVELKKKIKSLEGNMSLHEGILWNDLHKLEKENAELKEQQFSLRNERNTFLAQNEQYEKDLIDFNEQLTKAKEIIKKMLYVSCNSDVLVQYPNFSEVLQSRVDAENFLKDSEVEK